MERSLQMVNLRESLKLEPTRFEDWLARVKQRKSEEAEQQRLAAVKAAEERKAKRKRSRRLSLLAVVCLSLVAAVYLTHQHKVGPLERSRNLPFYDRSDWNQFYDPESARRFAGFAHRAYAFEEAGEAADGSAEGAPAAAAAGRADDGAADAMQPATATAAVDFRHRIPAAESPAPSDSAILEAPPSINSGAADVSALAVVNSLPADTLGETPSIGPGPSNAAGTSTPAPAASAAAPGDATELTAEETPATQAATRALPADAAPESAARVPAAPGITATPARGATANPVADQGTSAIADRVTYLPAIASGSGSDKNKKARSPAVSTKPRARPAVAPMRKPAPPKSVARAAVHPAAASRARSHAPKRQSTLQPRATEFQSAPQGYAQQPYERKSADHTF
jgi:hypothetical protein